MKLDIEKYLPYLDDPGLTRAQKEEIIRTVWGFMEAAVDEAFGLHPVQLARACAGNNKGKVLQIPAQRVDSKDAKVSYCFGRAANDNNHNNDDSSTIDKKERKNHAG